MIVSSRNGTGYVHVLVQARKIIFKSGERGLIQFRGEGCWSLPLTLISLLISLSSLHYLHTPKKVGDGGMQLYEFSPPPPPMLRSCKKKEEKKPKWIKKLKIINSNWTKQLSNFLFSLRRNHTKSRSFVQYMLISPRRTSHVIFMIIGGKTRNANYCNKVCLDDEDVSWTHEKFSVSCIRLWETLGV